MRALRSALLPVLVAPLLATTPALSHTPALVRDTLVRDTLVRDTLERVVPNDNRVAAGRMVEGVHRLALEARTGEWHPDGDDAPGTPMAAFAEVGKAPQIPGPMLRVREGTVVEVSVHNTLTDTLRVYGLHDRITLAAWRRPDGTLPPPPPPIVLAPGTTERVRFTAAAAGTYYYWGTTTNRGLSFRTGLDAQLAGAIVVDDARSLRRPDRVLVISTWADTVARVSVRRTRVLGTINGRSWPGTERLSYVTGDTVRWRVINMAADAHPMHLHGFFFRVEHRGDGTVERTDGIVEWQPSPVSADLAVTELMLTGMTATLAWVPERAGNWLFHCHVPDHFAPRAPLGMPRPPDTASDGAHTQHADHATSGMGGLVMGIAVRHRTATRARSTSAAPRANERRFRLVIRPESLSSAAVPRFQYVLDEPGAPRAPGAPARAGVPGLAPALDLQRGQPVRITVVNALAEPSAVHWHGIELESFFDGVAGFSGATGRTTPMIAPRDSFEVRFTPPRAGTFIYHTHADEARQQRAGLAGPIIVREPGAARNASTDIPIVLADDVDPAQWNRRAMLNGRNTPDTLHVRVGTTYRLRFVQMAVTWAVMRAELRRDSTLLEWTQVAKDGASIPPGRRAPQPAWLRMGIGEGYDVEFTPQRAGTMRLDIRQGIRWPVVSPLLVSLPIAVTEAR